VVGVQRGAGQRAGVLHNGHQPRGQLCRSVEEADGAAAPTTPVHHPPLPNNNNPQLFYSIPNFCGKIYMDFL
jgi:hypothetical protein